MKSTNWGEMRKKSPFIPMYVSQILLLEIFSTGNKYSFLIRQRLLNIDTVYQRKILHHRLIQWIPRSCERACIVHMWLLILSQRQQSTFTQVQCPKHALKECPTLLSSLRAEFGVFKGPKWRNERTPSPRTTVHNWVNQSDLWRFKDVISRVPLGFQNE